MKQSSRRGFTLVEILVALALTLFVLSIMSQAFVAGADAFHTMKAIGDMNDSLRVAATALRSDLSANHFEGNRRLSDSMFWTAPEFGPPKQGYMFIYQGPVATPDPQLEGVDGNGLKSYIRTNHFIAGTSRVSGALPQNFYTCPVPAGSPLLSLGLVDARYQQSGTNTATFGSQWIEWCYFLVQPAGNPTAGGSTPVYALCRQQRLVVSDVDGLNWTQPTLPAASFPVSATLLSTYQPAVSCQVNPNTTRINATTTWNNYLYFNSPADLTIPERRGRTGLMTYNQNNTPATLTFTSPPPLPFNALQTPAPAGPFSPLNAEHFLLTNVISFDVKVFVGSPGNASAGGGFSFTMAAGGEDFSDLTPLMAGTASYFDTWSARQDDYKNYASLASTQIPAQLNILALKITIRVWDPSTQLARQVSIIQEL